MRKVKFTFYKQPDRMDCGATCLRMISKHHGRSISLQKLRDLSETTREGASIKTISTAAENIGFRSLGVKVSFIKLMEDAPLPCIAFWQQKHFVVIYKIKGNRIHVADPAHGLLEYSKEDMAQMLNLNLSDFNNLF